MYSKPTGALINRESVVIGYQGLTHTHPLLHLVPRLIYTSKVLVVRVCACVTGYIISMAFESSQSPSIRL
uniref:Uncharacterized protein n=1 Tax=Anguilla anguilla TaxID=7936 RepID=A0A0E9WRU2_ANGAN